jgi:hypothetical protein
MSDSRTVKFKEEPIEPTEPTEQIDQWTTFATPLAPPPARFPEPPHAAMSWTACYDDDCTIHESSKRNSGYYPKQRSHRNQNVRRTYSRTRRNPSHQPCNCGETHDPELDNIIQDKNLNPKQACTAWSKGKRVCQYCEFLVNPNGHETRCGSRSVEPEEPITVREDTLPLEEPPMLVRENAFREEGPPVVVIRVEQDPAAEQPANEPVANDEDQENRAPENPQLVEVLAQVARIQRLSTETITAVHDVFQEGRQIINQTLERQTAHEVHLRQLAIDIQRITNTQQTLAQRLNHQQQRNRSRVQRPPRNNHNGLFGASAYRGGVMSQTTRNMARGAAIATVTWWAFGITLIAISYVNRN